MKYGFTIPGADLAVANAPELGGESKRAKVSYDEVGLLGEVSMLAPNSGTLQMATPAFSFDPVLGEDLQLRCKTSVQSSVNVVITFAVTFADATTGLAQAQFLIPSTAQNQSANLPMGLTVDLNGTAGNVGKKILSIAGLASVVGASRGDTFQLVSLPDAWWTIPGCTSKGETLNVPKAKSIANGLDGSAWTKYGMSEPGKLDLEAFHLSSGDGLQRLNDQPFSAMVEVYAEDRVLKERHVYGNVRGAFNADRKDGEDETKDKGTAEFSSFFKFV